MGPSLATVVASCYYVMPTLGEVALDAFYPIALAAIPVGWSAALALEGRIRSAALPALLAVLVEEEAALAVVGTGLFLFLLHPAARRIGTTLMSVGIVWLGLAAVMLMPSFAQPGRAQAETRVESHFEELRTRPLAWLWTVAVTRLEPDVLRWIGWPGARQQAACPVAGQCSALRWWLYPTGGVALLSPASLVMAAPPAAALLLADKPGRFRRHWAAPMLPVIWLSAVFGLGRLVSRPRLLRAGAAVMVAATLLMYRLDGSLPLGSQFEADDVVWKPVGVDLRSLRAEIPDGAVAVSSRRGLAHLSNRRYLYVFPFGDYADRPAPPEGVPLYGLFDLTNEATARELGASPPQASPAGRRVTPNALLLWTGL
jgi:uncharacterized membrane protein